MIKEIRFKDWKSFVDARLYIDPLTILIGTNASGKSNALDGFDFLNRITQGKELSAALSGDPTLRPLRGGIEWAARYPEQRFLIEALIDGQENNDYLYSIEVETSPRAALLSENLRRIKKTGNKIHHIDLFKTDPLGENSVSLKARLYNQKGGTLRELGRNLSALSQLSGLPLRQEINLGINTVSTALRSIFILDPIPSRMRDFSPLSQTLASDASNIAGVLAGLSDPDRSRIEEELSRFASLLPERDLVRVWAEPVGKFGTDAMLYCAEKWIDGAEPTVLDARGMSDGTLRFLAIVTALLTRPTGSLLIIEEIDNGLHPSRAHDLLAMLNELGGKRSVDVLVTTHNPALLNVLEPDLIRFVEVAHRDPETGASRLTLLEDIEQLPKLLAGGPLGQLVTTGDIERSLRVRA